MSSSAPAAWKDGSRDRPICVTSGPSPEATAVVSFSLTLSHGTASTSTITPVESTNGWTSASNLAASSMVQTVTVVPDREALGSLVGASVGAVLGAAVGAVDGLVELHAAKTRADAMSVAPVRGSGVGRHGLLLLLTGGQTEGSVA